MNEKLKTILEKYHPEKYFPNIKHLTENQILMNIFWKIGNLDSDIAGCMDGFLNDGFFREGNKEIFYACYDTLKDLEEKLKHFIPSNDAEKQSHGEMRKYVKYVLSVAEEFKKADKNNSK